MQFGGKLISFRNEGNAHTINISQVTTEPELVERSTQLEEVLANGNFIEYCRKRADEMSDQHNRYVWYFLKANFESDPHAEMLNLLGKFLHHFFFVQFSFSTNELVRK